MSDDGRGPVRLAEVLREAWRDVESGAAWACTAAVVLGVLLGGVVGLGAAAVASDVRAARDYVASGAATTVQRAEGRIDGRGCDAVGESGGVLAAGALRRVDAGVTPAALPRSVVPTYEVSAGFLPVVGLADGSGAGAVLSDAVQQELGLVRGETLVTVDGGATSVAGVYRWPDDGRDPDLEYAVLLPAVDDGRPYDACWATVWPERADTVSALRRTVLPTAGQEDADRPTVGQLNPRLGERFVPAAAPDDRWARSAAGVIGAAVGAAAVGRRRLALAADRHVGVTATAQALGIVAQHAVWAAVAVVAALAVSVVVVSDLAFEDAAPIVVGSAAVAVCGFVATLLGGVAGVLAVRGRALHRYFRSR